MTGLEALETISKVDYCFLEGELDGFFGMFSEEYNIIKKELQRLMVYDIQKEQTDKALETLRKEHQAIEIIKEKKVNVELLHICTSVEEYNMEILPYGNMPLTQEEYDLLKEVLL